MEQTSERIKKDFEERIESIEKLKEKKSAMLNTVLYTISIIMFLLVLCGTIMSYNNYTKVKDKANANNKVQSVELKI